MSNSISALVLLAVMNCTVMGCGVGDESLPSAVVARTPMAILSGLPDLVVEDIARNSFYYTYKVCNRGTNSSSSGFVLLTKNLGTGDTFTSNRLYPYDVPAPGTCLITGGLSCGLIGDPRCNRCMAIQVSVDSDDQVAESNETNNIRSSLIGCNNLPDLTIRSITRDSHSYYINYCNIGKHSSPWSFVFRTLSVSTGLSFESNRLYPYSVPAPGTCETTGGLTCGLIGDTMCSLNGAVEAFIDSNNEVAEASETNNKLTVEFGD